MVGNVKKDSMKLDYWKQKKEAPASFKNFKSSDHFNAVTFNVVFASALIILFVWLTGSVLIL